MTVTDFILLAMILAGALYGLLRGFRGALFFLVISLTLVLMSTVFIRPMERAILNSVNLGMDYDPDAPEILVLILADRTFLVYLAAFLPTLFAIFLLMVLGIGTMLLGRFVQAPSRSPASRGAGVLAGLAAGGTTALLFVAQLMRLPLPPNEWFQKSLLIAALNHHMESILPTLAGGY